MGKAQGQVYSSMGLTPGGVPMTPGIRYFKWRPHRRIDRVRYWLACRLLTGVHFETMPDAWTMITESTGTGNKVMEVTTGTGNKGGTA